MSLLDYVPFRQSAKEKKEIEKSRMIDEFDSYYNQRFREIINKDESIRSNQEQEIFHRLELIARLIF